MHTSILLDSFLSFFAGKTCRCAVDGTVGAGGHAFALLEAHPEIEQFYGFDRDPEALEIARSRLERFGEKVNLIHANFTDMSEHISTSVDAIFLDLGVSSMQLDRPEKGFSFSKEGPLDMRMNPSDELSAETVVNTYSEKDLAQIFFEYGEEPRARRAARAIVEARRKKRLRTTTDLADALKKTLTWGGRRGKKIHPLTLVFQALRIYVNHELKDLEEALPRCVELLNLEGRMGVITFHSLEDRIVKHTFRRLATEKKVEVLTKKPLIPDQQEIRQNPRSRSAKMRFIEKV